MTPFQKCLVLSILNYSQPITLGELSSLSGVEVEGLAEFLKEFPQAPRPELSYGFPEDSVMIYYSYIIKALEEMSDDDAGYELLKDSPLPIQLRVASHLLESSLFLPSNRSFYFDINTLRETVRVLLIFAQMRLNLSKYRSSRETAVRLVELLTSLLDLNHMEVILASGWKRYRENVERVAKHVQPLDSLRSTLLSPVVNK